MTRIRQAGPSDLDALLPLVAEFHEHERIELPAAERRAALGRLLGDPSLGAVLVAERGRAAEGDAEGTAEGAPKGSAAAAGGIVGYAILCLGYSVEFGGRDAFVDEAFVLPGSRGGGIGRALLAEAEAHARRLGARALHLEADHANPRAAELYRRLGFRDHPRHLMTLRLPEGPPGA
jgi:ribosomal protein S18 acetylase RimI-like enzyme